MKGYDIIIQGGQSNASGGGKGSAEAWIPDPDILYLEAKKEVSVEDGKIKVVFLDEPFSITLAGDRRIEEKEYGDFSLTFAKAYKDSGRLEEGRKLLIIRAGVGGTGFLQGNWNQEGNLYTKMLQLIEYALQLEGENRLVAFLWHQGEDDVFRNNSYEGYSQQLGYLIDSVRERYMQPTLPFIAGEFIEEWSKEYEIPERLERINKAIKRVISEREHCALVSSKGLLSNRQEGNDDSDNIHFCRQSLREFGRRYFQAFTNL